MRTSILAFTLLTVAVVAAAQDAPPPNPGDRSYSPYPEQDFPNRVLFGDSHVHTSYSPDAKFFGLDLPDDVPASIQERAYTSPVWYGSN